MVQANGVSGDRLKQQLDAIAASGHKDRFVVFTSINWRAIRPGFGATAAAAARSRHQGRRARAGRDRQRPRHAHQQPDGTRLKLDDPELDPVWDKAGELKIPVFIHTGEPQEFFEPLDYNNERWLELALFQDRRHQERRARSKS